MNLDNALVSDFNRDHPDGFAALFNSYYPPLCRFAEKILHSSDDAEDVVADVFSRLWAKDVVSNINTSIKGFLYSTVRNSCIDLLRKKSAEATRNQAFGYQLQDESNFFGSMWRAEVLQEIIQEIESLPEQCRVIFKKLYIDGLSHKEVAAEMALTESTVRNQKSRAIALLKRKLFPDSVFTITAVAVTAATLLTLIVLMLYLIHVR